MPATGVADAKIAAPSVGCVVGWVTGCDVACAVSSAAAVGISFGGCVGVSAEGVAVSFPSAEATAPGVCALGVCAPGVRALGGGTAAPSPFGAPPPLSPPSPLPVDALDTPESSPLPLSSVGWGGGKAVGADAFTQPLSPPKQHS